MYSENSKTIKLYLTGLKGLETLRGVLNITNDVFVCFSTDVNVEFDYSIDIVNACKQSNVHCYHYDSEKFSSCRSFGIAIAAGWQKMIRNIPENKLIVFHDSILPKYRGFNPLVTALIKRDEFIGVSAISAAERYDEGDVYYQEIINISYPITIKDAIQRISFCYRRLAEKICMSYYSDTLTSQPQNHNAATYSLWRNEDDYRINWFDDADDISHFIRCVGYPYKGALSYLNGLEVRIRSATVLPDVLIENRSCGKVIFKHDDKLIVVCGKGLLRLDDITVDSIDNPSIGIRSKFI
ncbi:methionyl-tRNA formyltransferase [Aeromonas sp. 82P]|uniref:methionyl-tRNA formyltransferase n=1 Tax=Aeromonas sp. 82P TaxID=3452726 RepID=UPI003F78D8F8